jgi:hypothetical protein
MVPVIVDCQTRRLVYGVASLALGASAAMEIIFEVVDSWCCEQWFARLASSS